MKLRIWIDPQDGSVNLFDEDDNWFCQTSRPNGSIDGDERVRAEMIRAALEFSDEIVL